MQAAQAHAAYLTTEVTEQSGGPAHEADQGVYKHHDRRGTVGGLNVLQEARAALDKVLQRVRRVCARARVYVCVHS